MGFDSWVRGVRPLLACALPADSVAVRLSRLMHQVAAAGFHVFYLVAFFCGRVCGFVCCIPVQWPFSEIALSSYRWKIRPFKLRCLPKQPTLKVICQ